MQRKLHSNDRDLCNYFTLTITLHVSCSGKLLVGLITSQAIFFTREKLFTNQLFHREIFIITRWSECPYITSRNFSLFFSSRLSLTVVEFFRTVLEFQQRHFERFANMISPTIRRKWKCYIHFSSFHSILSRIFAIYLILSNIKIYSEIFVKT